MILNTFLQEEPDKKSFEAVALNGPKCASGNLYTNEGLQTASFKDIFQIFDNSDDASSDETVTNIHLLLIIEIIFTKRKIFFYNDIIFFYIHCMY